MTPGGIAALARVSWLRWLGVEALVAAVAIIVMAAEGSAAAGSAVGGEALALEAPATAATRLSLA